jgi:hypothetical protein
MTSERKRTSNRVNAKASTGPKTTLGKLRARKSAYRHGLSISILSHPDRSAEVEELALEIAGEGANPHVVELAHRIAEAQIDLVRVRKTRDQLLRSKINDREFMPRKYFADTHQVIKLLNGSLQHDVPHAVPLPEVMQHVQDVIYWKPQGPERLLHILSDISHQLIAMDRYERRALSRRKFAIRDFDLARQQAVKSDPAHTWQPSN